MANNKGGTLLQDFGMLLAPQTTMGIMQAPLVRDQIAQKRDQSSALTDLIGGLTGKQPTQDLNVSGIGPAIPANLRMGRGMDGGAVAPSSMANFLRDQAPGLAVRAAPETTLQGVLSTIIPKAPLRGKERFAPSERGVVDLESGGYVPGTMALPKVPDILVPGVLEAEIRKANATRAPTERWTPLAVDQIKQLGLDPAGTYQVNDKGQINVITQPKQNNPTEAQQKYAYNARRLADAMTAAQTALKGDPSAVTSGTLEATQDSWIPGAAFAGRALTGANEQIVRNNLGDAIDAALTLGTGAAYNKEQLDAARASLLPRAGETDAVKQDKFRKMKVLYDQAKINAHSAGVDLPDPALFEQIYAPAKPAPQTQAAVGGRVPVQAPPIAQRTAGQKYDTPRGKMTWTGTGWVP